MIKAHVATDESGSLVPRVAVTPANRHDSQGVARLIERYPGRVWADSAYDSGAVRALVRRRGRDRIMRRINERSGFAAVRETRWFPAGWFRSGPRAEPRA
jgi:IS5 family transposase